MPPTYSEVVVDVRKKSYVHVHTVYVYAPAPWHGLKVGRQKQCVKLNLTNLSSLRSYCDRI